MSVLNFYLSSKPQSYPSQVHIFIILLIHHAHECQYSELFYFSRWNLTGSGGLGKQVNSNVKQWQWSKKRSSHSGVTEVFSNRLLLFWHTDTFIDEWFHLEDKFFVDCIAICGGGLNCLGKAFSLRQLLWMTPLELRSITVLGKCSVKTTSECLSLWHSLNAKEGSDVV